MAEKTVPWWRKALSYALEGIRSGFGFFTRTPKPAPPEPPPLQETLKEELEKETRLPQPPANPKTAVVVLAVVPEPVEQPEATPAILPVPAPEVVAVDEPAETIEMVAAPEAALPTVASVPDREESASPVFEPILEPVFDSVFNSPAEPEEAVAQEAVEPEHTADPQLDPCAPEPEEQPSVLEPEVQHFEVEQAQEARGSVTGLDFSPAADTPIKMETLQSAEKLQPEVDSISTEGGGGFNPRTKPTEPMRALAPEGDFPPIPPELSSFSASCLAPEERVVEPAPEPILAAEPPSDSTPLELNLSNEDSAESLQSPESSSAVDEPPTAAQAEPENPRTGESTVEPVAAPSPEAQTASPAELIAEAAPEATPIESQFAPVADPQTPVTAEITAPSEPAPPEPPAPPVVDEKAAARLAARQKKLAEADEQSPFSVIVDHVYDGPLDLLLDLIRKQDIDIYDIPIAKITSQFLAYVNQLRAGDVDVAGEFIYIASLLIHIKSKMLLPRAPAGPEDTPEDPRRELVERLLEHERFKNAAQMLQQKQMLEAASWTNPGAQEFKDDEAAEPEIAADTVDLVRIFRDILERARTRPTIDVSEDQVTVGQMIQFLARRLTMEDKPVALRRLLSHTRSERSLIAMFLALLELVRLQAVLLRQDRQFSEIFIKKHTGFDSVMNEGLVNARDDWK